MVPDERADAPIRTGRPAARRSFGTQLRALRERAGLSQEALAERAGLGVATLAALEHDRRQRPHPHTLARLADALRLPEAERTAWLDLASGVVPQTSTASPATPAVNDAARLARLPVPPTPLISREAEVAEIRGLLEPRTGAARLVTLVGPGGVGKTRLALAVAATLTDAYPEGVVFVDLAPLRDARLVPATVSRALGLREGGGRSARELLIEYLAERQVVLVLDNFERLLPAAPLLAELLAVCPSLALLVTSRAALRVRGERRLTVLPLAASNREDSLRSLAAAPAVRLFVERAQAVASDFQLEERNGPAIAAICRQLDGLPLAIELAAAWAGVLAPEALLRRLEHPLPLLTGGAADVPDRQQTLGATLDWSHDLLGRAERVLFRRLAVFAGSWSLEAAEAICADGELPASELLKSLQVLVDHSLVRRLPAAGDEPRFGMLETIREYALDHLVASADAESCRSRHRDWYRALAERVETEWVDPSHVARLDQEQDNLRAALRWSIDRRDVVEGLRLAIAGGQPLWYLRGRYAEGRAWFSELLALSGALEEPRLRAAALVWAGQLAHCEGATADADALLQQALWLAESVADARAIANAEQILGNVARGRGDLDSATQHYTRALHIAKQEGRRSTETWALYCLAMTCLEQGDSQGGHTFLAQLSELLAVYDNPTARARLQVIGSRLASMAGHHAQARAGLALDLRRIEEQGDQQGLVYAHRLAAYSALDRSDWAEAAQHASQMLHLARATNDRVAQARALDIAAELLTGTGQFARALRLAAAADVLRQSLGVRLVPVEVTHRDRWFERAHLALAGAADAAVAAGRGTPLAQAVEDAGAACGALLHGGAACPVGDDRDS